jgi:enoyl-CoA hydratase
MVNHVVERDNLEEFSLEMANKIAERPIFALKMAKKAVNVAQDNMGHKATQETSLALHHMCHAHNAETEMYAVKKEGMPEKFRTPKEAAE